MSILIAGIDMPTSCARCPMLEGDMLDGLCHAASRWLDDDEYWTWYSYPEGVIDDSKPCNCPLVPVPPHGRLIDADALYREIKAECNPYGKPSIGYDDGLKVLGIIGSTPPVIPAEER